MSRFLAVVLCAAGIFAADTSAQVSGSGIEPIRVPAGTTLTFHLQTRLRHTDADPLDVLPQGTIVHVKILSAIDSSIDRDGSEFRGTVVSDLATGYSVVIRSDSEVRGLLVLLRSRNHPEGFRYELLLTQLAEGGKSYPLTASLDSSIFDSGSHAPTATKAEMKELPKANVSGNTRIAVNPAQ
jgi:hypothetical protein